MARCSGCGEEMATGLKFCTRCGKPAQDAGGGQRCPRCGAEQAPGKRFCVACGTPLAASGPAAGATSGLPPMARPAAPPPGTGMPPPGMGAPMMATRPQAPAPPARPPFAGPPPAGPPPSGPPPGVGLGGSFGNPVPPAGYAVPMAAPKRGNGGLLVAVLLLLILSALGIGGYLAYRHLTGSPEGERAEATIAADAPAAGVAEPGTTAVRRGPADAVAGAVEQGAIAGQPGQVAETGSMGQGRQPDGKQASSPDVMDDPWVKAPLPGAGTAGSAGLRADIPAAAGGGDERFLPPVMAPEPSITDQGSQAAAMPATSGAWQTATSGGTAGAMPAPLAPTLGEVSAMRPAPGGGASAPASGVIVWSGPLRKDALVTIDGDAASAGSLRGVLPGVPVAIETDFRDVGFAEMPSPANGWKRVSLRGRKNGNVVVTLRWRALR